MPVLRPLLFVRRVLPITRLLDDWVSLILWEGLAFPILPRSLAIGMCMLRPGLALSAICTQVTVPFAVAFDARDVPATTHRVQRGVLDDELPAIEEVVLGVDERLRRVLCANEVDECPPVSKN